MRTDQLRILSLTTFFENNKLTSEQIGARSINLTSKQIGARSISINFWTNRRTQKEAICNFRRSSRCPAHKNPEKSCKNQDRFLQSRFFWIRRKSRLKEAILIFDAILGDFLDAQPTKILKTAPKITIRSRISTFWGSMHAFSFRNQDFSASWIFFGPVYRSKTLFGGCRNMLFPL